MSTRQDDVTVVVRGTGSVGLRYLRVLRDRLGVAPVGIPVRPGRTAELEAMNFEALATVGELVTRESVRSIVATDTSRHLDDAYDLLQHGDVLVEKPLAASISGLAEFANVAIASERKVLVAFCLRHNKGLQHVRRRLPAIGDAHSVRIECQSYLPDWRADRDYRESYSARRSEGGVLRDLAHELDYAVWLFGRPDRVWCVLGNRGRLGIESEESADLLWQTAGGAVVSLRLDYVTRQPRRRMTAAGDRATLEWDHVAGTVVLTECRGRREIVHVGSDHDDMIAAQAAEFLELGGAPAVPVSCTLDEAGYLVAMTDAAYGSAASGCWQKVADWARL